MFGEPSATCRGGRVSVRFRVFRGSKKIYTFYTLYTDNKNINPLWLLH